jgi:hypothetical protein
MSRSSLTVIFLFLAICCFGQTAETLSLKGKWKFQTDAADVGIAQEWFHRHLLPDTIHLPGSMAENGKGNDPSLTTPWTGSIFDSSWYFNPAMERYRKPGNIKFPFWLTPVKYYVGAAWYQKEIIIPKSWKGKSVQLFLERPHWQTMVWVDGMAVGKQNSLSIPHRFDVPALTAGKHIITVRIDNRCIEIDPGNNSHSITDHTQGNWNGMVGRLELQALSPLHIDDVQVFPNVADKNIQAMVVMHRSSQKAEGTFGLSVKLANTAGASLKPLSVKWNGGATDTLRIVYPMGDSIRLWDEFTPNLYNLTITFTDKIGNADTQKVAFGMREYKVHGTRFEINGRPIFLRGNVDCCIFPLTGYPSADEESWARIYKVCREHGLNHVRFHSYCPPKAAFTAADKAGFYLQVEGPSWANYTTSLGDGKPIDPYIYQETERILKEYGNHPSFCMMASGNEPRGNYVPFLNKYVTYWKNKDSRRVYTGASTGGSWKIIPESEYLVRAKPRGIRWGSKPETNFDYRDKLEDQTKPYITHEMGQWCVFPNFAEMPKYTGIFKPKNFEIFQEDFSEKHTGDQAHDFLMASGKLQALCYKQEIEATLRTPGFAGFQLLGLNDFPGQGTALVGVLDAFWDEKGYISAHEFSQFCNATVPLARMGKFVYSNAETFSANLEVAHFGAKPIEQVLPSWTVANTFGEIITQGKLDVQTIPIGNCISLGSVHFPLSAITKAQQLTFRVSIGTFSNHWDFWVYPANLPQTDSLSVHICTELDIAAQRILQSGGKVLLLVAGKVENGKEVVQNYTPVFWNTSWFKMRPPHTTGVLVKPEHPVFASFPTDYWGNLQWAEITHREQVMNLENFPATFRPLIQPIDTWFLNRRLAMLFEAKVGNGKLMVCSIDLKKDIEKRIVARQLYYSIVTYMQSDKFAPQAVVELSVIKELFEKKERKGWDSFTKDVPAELKTAK